MNIKKIINVRKKDKWKDFGYQEYKKIFDMLRSGEISSPGKGEMKKFEEEFANYIGTKHALAQNNGTSTLLAAYHAIGISEGDEVLLSTYTWHATATPILLLGAIPVFCDIDSSTLQIDPKDIERKITKKTKAIAVTHMWGNVVDLKSIKKICHDNNLKLIEDASHAHGSEYNGRKIGTFGDIACFSLQAAKAVAAGEAGIIVTNDDNYYDNILALGHYGRITRHKKTDTYDQLNDIGLGFKFRAHPLAMGLARVRLNKLDLLNDLRRKYFYNMDKIISGFDKFKTISTYQNENIKRGGLIGYRILIDDGKFNVLNKTNLLKIFNEHGLNATNERYSLLHNQPLFNGDLNKSNYFNKKCEIYFKKERSGFMS